MTIENFSAVGTNQTDLFGFGSSAAAAAIAGATSASGNTTLHLSNGTTVTFIGLAAPSLNTTNVVSTT